MMVSGFEEAWERKRAVVQTLLHPVPGWTETWKGVGLCGFVCASVTVYVRDTYGRVSAANALPFLAGSGPVVAQLYGDETLAYTAFNPWQLISLPVLVWILGVIDESFVPALPFNTPRREFGVYGWLALFSISGIQS